MQIILLSGGSGKRLWPLSNDVRSKQFLKLFSNRHGERQSMVQRVYGQIKEAIPGADITVATNAAQADSIRGQLGNTVDIVIEPERRDTYPAIAFSCAYLAYEKGVSSDETVVVLPVDPFTEPAYFETLKHMTNAVKEDFADIALMGIKPTFPTSKYGYIVTGKSAKDNVFPVSQFVEKPEVEAAAKLIESGAFWNGGVFAFRLGYMTDIVRSALPFSSFSGLREKYSLLKKISFDYEVVEKADKIAMIPFEGMWTDVGTWRTLADEIETNSLGNVIMKETTNTYVINEMNIPIVALGTNDLIVAASPDGILVSDLVQSSQLKPIVDRLESRPMYEERRWGEYTVIDTCKYADDKHSLIKRLFLEAGKSISYQSHKLRDEIWVVTDGEADFALEGDVRRITSGSAFTIPKSAKHAVRAVSDTNIIEVQIGELLVEDDIIKYDWAWPDE
jgi:mannose-1-phosphate guanylyltransferase